MKCKLISCVFVLFLIQFSMPMYAQTYEKLWQEVESLQVKDLPKSIVEQVDQIYEKAYKEKNTPEMMKAYIYRMNYRESLSPDSFYVDVNGLEKWIEQTNNALDLAILHSILGEVYGQYISSYYNGTSDITRLIGIVDKPEEWITPNLLEKSLNHFRLSLQDYELLGKTSSELYKPIVIEEDGSEYYHHDLLHLLGIRAINTLKQNISVAEEYYNQTRRINDVNYWSLSDFLAMDIHERSTVDYRAEILKLYQLLLQYYSKSKDLSSSLIVTELSRLDYIYRNLIEAVPVTDTIDSLPYYQELVKLLSYAYSSEVSLEIYIQLVELARQNNQLSEAVKFAREGIAKFPAADRANYLRNQEMEIVNPQVYGSIRDNIYPGKNITLTISYKNLTEIDIKLFRVNLPASSDILFNYDGKSSLASYTDLISANTYNLKSTLDYQSADTTLNLNSLNEGIYLLEIGTRKEKTTPSYNLIYVTNLQLISRRLPGDITEFVVLEKESGHPVPGARIFLYNREQDKLILQQKYLTDQKGILEIPYNQSNYYIRAEVNKDFFMQPVSSGYNYYRGPVESKKNEVISLFTDRSIYRPGQTVYLAGIVYEQEKDEFHVLESKEYSVELYDVNNRVIDTKQIRTNEYGTFSAEFILPSSALNGNFRLKAGTNSINVRVEEYKRPTFQVNIDPILTSYVIGDTVEVRGEVKTFTGVPLENALVNYTVVRQSNLFWWRGRQAPRMISSGEVSTNDSGEFIIDVFLEPDDRKAVLDYWYSTYKIETIVTQVTGETQTAVYSINVGNRSLVLSSDLSGQIIKEGSKAVAFFATNLNQKPVEVKGRYEIWSLEDVETGDQLKSKVLTGDFIANQSFELTDIKKLLSGKYRLILSANDEQNREVKYETDFLLFSLKDKKPPIKTANWFYPVQSEFNSKQKASLLFGTSEKDVHVLYDVFSGNRRLESKWIQLSDTILNMEYEYQEMYGDGILVQLTFVKDGIVYQNEARITKTRPEKELKMEWEVFRDHLIPGQQEEWRLKISYPDNTPVEAELIATLYDASLDQFVSHDWNMGLSFSRIVPTIRWNINYSRNLSFYLDFPIRYLKYKQLLYDDLITTVLRNVKYGRGGLYMNLRGGALKASRSANGPDFADEEMVLYSVEESAVLTDIKEEGMVYNIIFEEESIVEPESIRENLNETAFFYPYLRTDKEGKVSISFTLPESLTEWNFIGLSHTKQMDYGKLRGNTIARKDFMVSPNLPRFIRVKDQTSINSAIINLTENTINGEATLELSDPETDKVYYSQKQSFVVSAGKTENIKFTFVLEDENISLLTCRIMAKGDGFSDGEQSYLPVLSDKVRLTETIPFTVVGQTTTSYGLDTLYNHNSETATNRSLTIEYSGNPAWYAVQALPNLVNPNNDNAVAWATSYYANRLSSFVVSTNPRIEAIFKNWKTQDNDLESLWSNLQKNPDLKNIILEETPWVMEATTEAEQKQRLALLFNTNMVNEQLRNAVNKLQELQLADGSWSWYKGMMGSRYITQFVLETLTREKLLTGSGFSSEVEQMYDKGFSYLYKEIIKEYKEVVEDKDISKNKYRVSELTVHYLYICSLAERVLPEEVSIANRYFIDQLAGYNKELSIYGKAQSAIICYKNGKQQAAMELMNSLKEYTIVSKDGGVYFDTPDLNYIWYNYRIPTQVAAIEAVDMIANDKELLDGLKIWLLQQKRTQTWDTPISTVNAIYALLQRGQNLLDNRGEASIQVGSNRIEVDSESSVIPGINYIKKKYEGDEITDLNRLVVTKKDEGLSWGAVYAQYDEVIDKVQEYGSLFSVKKTLFVEKSIDGKAQLIPLEDVETIKAGDKIISRLVIQTDRDIEFVHLKDQRASCLEPYNVLSGYRYERGAGYYVSVKDASTEYFFDKLTKGTYLFEQTYFVVRSGTYSSGLAILQSMYAPEYSAFSKATQIEVK